MNIQDLFISLRERGFTNVATGNLVGLSAIQIQLYIGGQTKTPGSRTAYEISQHITLNGKPLIIEPFKDIESIELAYHTFAGNGNALRSRGSGTYELGN
ncbi:MAG: hypothetical protein JHC33_08810 [Ignisphaera sp.]|nr:hypothetical protein [Ignisphaera sp.]